MTIINTQDSVRIVEIIKTWEAHKQMPLLINSNEKNPNDYNIRALVVGDHYISLQGLNKINLNNPLTYR